MSRQSFGIAAVLLLLLCLAALCACSDESSDTDGDASDGDADPADGDTPDGDADEPADGDADMDGDAEEESAGRVVERIERGGLVIDTDPDTARLSIESTDGRVLLDGLGAGGLSENGPHRTGFAVRDVTIDYEMMFGAFKPADTENGPWIEAKTSVLTDFDDRGELSLLDENGKELLRIVFTTPEDGHLKAEVNVGENPERRVSWAHTCLADDHFMGFGAQTWDVDHRGQSVFTWVQEQGVGKVEHDDYDFPDWMYKGRRHSSHLPIPQYLARRGYVLTVKTDLRATFDLCSVETDGARMEFQAPATVHVFDGPTPAQALERSSLEFGRPPVPPSFAFAPWIDAIYGSANVRRVVAKLRDEGVPASVIWTEDWKGAEQRGDNYVLSEEWELDRELYPDFEDLADDLHAAGFKFFTYFNTFVYQEASAWEETAENGYLIETAEGEPYVFQGHKFSDCSLVDLSDPDGYAWTMEKLTEAMNQGVDGWMGDFAEWMPTDAVTAGGSGLEQHNRHPVQWQQAQREAIDAMNDGAERMFFGRSGYFGTVELADVIWAADQRTGFQEDDGLPTILPIGIGLGITGISTYAHDIAGYQSATNDPSTKELYYRWTELGAWSPVMRTHHGYQANLNWNWEKDEETLAHFRRYAKLHVALTPYWEGLARVAHERGLSIWRGMGVMYPQEENLWPVKDQVMVGDGLLVAPVMEEGALSRDVLLPPDLWFAWDGDGLPLTDDLDGGTWSVDAPLSEIPVFARGGAIVPMYPDGVMTLAPATEDVAGPESVGDDRRVAVFAGIDKSRFEEKDGLSYTFDVGNLTRIQGLPFFKFSKDGLTNIHFLWNETELSACLEKASAACWKQTDLGRFEVFVQGNGELEIRFGGSEKLWGDSSPSLFVTAEGGADTREIIFDLHL